MVVRGLLGVAAGLFTLLSPGITATALVLYIAFWAILTGVIEILAAIRLRREIEGEGLLALGGLASVGFGILLVARPAAGAVALVWIIAAYAIVYGALLVALAIKAKGFADRAAGARPKPGR